MAAAHLLPSAYTTSVVAQLRATLDTCGTSSDTIIRPILADFVDRLEVQRLQVGRARVTLRFEHFSEGVAVKVRKVESQEM